MSALDESKELEVVYVTSDPSKFIVAKSLLESAGVTYFTKGEHTANFFGWGGVGSSFPVNTQLEILVPKDEVENCREVIRELDARS